MPIYMELTSNGMMQGPLGGRLVSCVLEPGFNIPPGQYMLQAAVEDPIYGTLVPMIPIAQPAAAKTVIQTRDASEKWIGARSMKDTSAAGRIKAGQFVADKDVPVSQKVDVGAAQAIWLKRVENPNTPGGFILSAKPMPGRNNVLVHFGFADLVEGSRMGGGVVVVT